MPAMGLILLGPRTLTPPAYSRNDVVVSYSDASRFHIYVGDASSSVTGLSSSYIVYAVHCPLPVPGPSLLRGDINIYMLYILLARFVRPWCGSLHPYNLKRMDNVLTSVAWRFARQLHPQNMHSFDCSNITFGFCVSFP